MRDPYAARRRRNIRLVPDHPDKENPVSDIAWEEPVEARRGGASTKWRLILEPLKENPGKWAYMGVHNRGIASYLRRTYPDYEFAMRTERPSGEKTEARKEGQREPDIFLYARFKAAE